MAHARFETEREVLAVAAVALQGARQVAVGRDVPLDDFRPPERVEAEGLAANGHQAVARLTAGWLDGDDVARPTALQAVPGEDPAGLQRLAEVSLAAGERGENERWGENSS